jgi:hypothetical protein
MCRFIVTDVTSSWRVNCKVTNALLVVFGLLVVIILWRV